jgi:uncharacterized protein (TIGR02646 family)
MKYINKGKEPQTLQTLKNMAGRNFIPSFDNLPPNVIYEIINNLLLEQGFLCCYCMNEIAPDSAKLVHFLPFKDEMLNYSNMYLACNYSNHLPPSQQHCYIKKESNLIPKYMADPQCSDYFRYNTLGEILPSGTFRTLKKCTDNYRKLTPVQQAVLSAIDILNLNSERLKDQRKALLTQLATSYRWATKAQVQQAIINFGSRDKQGRFKRFCEVILYYLKTV